MTRASDILERLSRSEFVRRVTKAMDKVRKVYSDVMGGIDSVDGKDQYVFTSHKAGGQTVAVYDYDKDILVIY